MVEATGQRPVGGFYARGVHTVGSQCRGGGKREQINDHHRKGSSATRMDDDAPAQVPHLRLSLRSADLNLRAFAQGAAPSTDRASRPRRGQAARNGGEVDGRTTTTRQQAE